MLRLNFTTVTPLHIGNGEQLGYGIDYIIKNNFVYRLNPQKVATLFAEKHLVDFRRDYSFKDVIELIQKHYNLLNENHSSYKVKASQSFVEQINNERAIGRKYFGEFINSNGNFYIPASSVKGALLTVLNLNQLGISTEDPKIVDKVVFTDSDYITSNNFEVYLTNNRPPKVSLLCLKEGVNFSLTLRKTGSLNKEQMRKCLEVYSHTQIELAKKYVIKYKSKPGQRPKGADIYFEALNEISKLSLTKNEYLINIGFGGGSWFKVFKNIVPKFPSKSPNRERRGKDEEAHTSVSFNFNGRTDHIGWCKLKIEEV